MQALREWPCLQGVQCFDSHCLGFASGSCSGISARPPIRHAWRARVAFSFR